MNIEDYTLIERIEGDNEVIKLQDSQIDCIARELDAVNSPESSASIIEICDSAIKSFYPKLGYKINFTSLQGRNSSVDNALGHIESRYFEAPPDHIQVEQIAEHMCTHEELKFENWSKLSHEDQINFLNQLDKEFAEIQHRKPQTVSSERFDEPNLFGIHQGDKIVINSRLLELSTKDPQVLQMMLETFVHEGRHAYQEYNVCERRVHQSQAEVNSWAENWEVYSPNNKLGYYGGDPVKIPLIGPLSFTNQQMVDFGERLYYYQPTEIDAREYASDVMSKYVEILSSPRIPYDELAWMRIMAEASPSPFNDFWKTRIKQSPSFTGLKNLSK